MLGRIRSAGIAENYKRVQSKEAWKEALKFIDVRLSGLQKTLRITPLDVRKLEPLHIPAMNARPAMSSGSKAEIGRKSIAG